MTEDLGQGFTGEANGEDTGSEALLGARDAAELVGQAAITIAQPAPGQNVSIRAEAGQHYVVAFDPDSAQVRVQGNDLILEFANGATVTLENLGQVASEADGPVFEIAGQPIASAVIFAQAGGTFETAARPIVEGTGETRYDDDTGELIDLIDPQGVIPGVEREFGLIELEPSVALAGVGLTPPVDFDVDVTANFFDSLADAGLSFADGVGFGGGTTQTFGFTNAGGEDLNLDDDDTQSVDLSFAFPFLGDTYTAITVSSNGFIWLGTSETDDDCCDADDSEFLSDPPRIAPAWFDLDPGEGGGSITVADLGDSIVITWQSVPEFSNNDGNTFQVQLFADGRIVFNYETLNADTSGGHMHDAIIGITGGNGASDPGETDLSPFGSFNTGSQGTVYEFFERDESDGADNFDLSGQTIVFTPNGSGGWDVTTGSSSGTVVVTGDGGGLASSVELITNGGFESGDFTGWAVFDGGEGSFFIDDASDNNTPLSGLEHVGPADGNFFAISDQTDPAVSVLEQSFTVPSGTTSIVLSFDMFANNWHSETIIAPEGLDLSVANQHARVEILSSPSGPFETGGVVLATFYLGADNVGQTIDGYTHYEFDLTGIVEPGQTYDLRFAEVDTQFFFNQGVDNVSIVATNLVAAIGGGFLYEFQVGEAEIVVDNIHGTDLEDGVTTQFTITTLPTGPDGTPVGFLLIDRGDDGVIEEIVGPGFSGIPINVQTGDSVWYFLPQSDFADRPDLVTFNYFTVDSDNLDSLGDGPATITINLPDAQPVIVSADPTTVDEDDLPGAVVDRGQESVLALAPSALIAGDEQQPGTDVVDGPPVDPTTVTGGIAVNFDFDRPGTLTFNQATINGLNALGLTSSTVKSGAFPEGEPLVYEIGNATRTLTAFAGEDGPVVFTVTLSPAVSDGPFSYTFELFGSINHPLTDDPATTDVETAFEDPSVVPLTFVATDVNGDSANGSFNVTLVDDVPEIAFADAGGPFAYSISGENPRTEAPELFRVDLSTGESTNLGPLIVDGQPLFGDFEGLTFGVGANAGSLFAYDDDFEGSTPRVVRINPANGDVTAVWVLSGAAGFDSTLSDPGFTIAIDGRIFVIGSDDGLAEIALNGADGGTFTVTEITDNTQFSESGLALTGLAADPNDASVLYALGRGDLGDGPDTTRLVKITLVPDAEPTIEILPQEIGFFDENAGFFSNEHGLAFAPDGTLWGLVERVADVEEDPVTLAFRIDPATGATIGDPVEFPGGQGRFESIAVTSAESSNLKLWESEIDDYHSEGAVVSTDLNIVFGADGPEADLGQDDQAVTLGLTRILALADGPGDATSDPEIVYFGEGAAAPLTSGGQAVQIEVSGDGHTVRGFIVESTIEPRFIYDNHFDDDGDSLDGATPIQIGAAPGPVVIGGQLVLTDESSSNQNWIQIDGGAPLSGNFRAAFDLLIDDQGAAGQADGVSFQVGNDVATTGGPPEESRTSGLALTFDTFDNFDEFGGPDVVNEIALWFGGVKFSSVVPVGGIHTDAPVPVVVEVIGTLVMVSYNGAVLFGGPVDVGGTVPSDSDFYFGARTGAFADFQAIDNVRIEELGGEARIEVFEATIDTSPGAPGTENGQFTFRLFEQLDHPDNDDPLTPDINESEFTLSGRGGPEIVGGLDNIRFEFNVTATDDDGDAVSVPITVDVDDDGPTIETQTAVVDEDGLPERTFVDTPDGGGGTGGETGGNFLAVWVSDDEGTNVLGRMFDSAGVPQGPEFDIGGTTAVPLSRPSVTELADGRFLVGWSGNGAGDTNGIFGRFLGADGTPQGDEFLINQTTAGGQSAPSVTALEGGGFLVSWHGNGAGDPSGVFGRIFNAAGAPQGDDILINETTASFQDFSATTALEGGGFLVSWSGIGAGDDDDAGVFARIFNAAGAPQGGEITVNETTAGSQEFASTAGLPGGGFVVTWDSHDPSGDSGVFARVFNAAGIASGGDIPVSETTLGDQVAASVATLADGGFVVSWIGNGAGDDVDVFARTFDADGAPRGGEFPVNATTLGNQSLRSVEALPDGGFLVTWEGNGDGDDSGAFGRIFDVDGTPRGGEFLINEGTAGSQNFVVAAVAGGTGDTGTGGDTGGTGESIVLPAGIPGGPGDIPDPQPLDDGNEATFTGNLGVDFGADGPGDIDFAVLDGQAVVDASGVAVLSRGDPVSYEWDAATHTLSAVAQGSGGGTGGGAGGSIFITGHDSDEHENYDYDSAGLDYLVFGGAADASARAGKTVALLHNGPVLDDGTTVAEYIADIQAAKGWDVTFFDLSDADWTDVFSDGFDVIMVASIEDLAGDDPAPAVLALAQASRDALVGAEDQFADYINSGGGLFIHTDGEFGQTWYDFVPQFGTTQNNTIEATGAFTATPAGIAIGLTEAIVDADQTHSFYTGVDTSLFTVFEVTDPAFFPDDANLPVAFGARGIGIQDGEFGFANTRPIFELEITDVQNGVYELTLLDSVDHPLTDDPSTQATETAFEDNIFLNLPFTATDFDGDTAAGSLNVRINDDSPARTGETVVGVVEEEQNPVPGGNEDTTANPDLDEDTEDPEDFDVTTNVVTGSVASLVSFGADGPGGFSLSDDTSGLRQDLTSLGEPIGYGFTEGGVLVGFTGASFDPTGEDQTNWVFTLALSGDLNADYTFTLLAPLDHHPVEQADDVEGFLSLDFSSIVVATDFDGDSITLAPEAFVINAIDDVPVIDDGTATVAHDETPGIDDDADDVDLGSVPLPDAISALGLTPIGAAQSTAGQLAYRFGADGPGQASLTGGNGEPLDSVDSGLVRTSDGASIFLFSDAADPRLVLGATGPIGPIGADDPIGFDASGALNEGADTLTLAGHGLVDGQEAVYSSQGDVSIGGLANGGTYFVIVVDANTIKLAASENGPAIDLSSALFRGSEHSLDPTPIPGGDIVLAIYLDTGVEGADASDDTLWVAQFEAIKHPLAGDDPLTDHDDSVSMPNGLPGEMMGEIFLTVTDFDGDSVTAPNALTVEFQDDGPSVGNIEMINDETFGLGDDTPSDDLDIDGSTPETSDDATIPDAITDLGINEPVINVSSKAIAFDYGADGPGGIALNDVDNGTGAGLVDTATGRGIFLFNGADDTVVGLVVPEGVDPLVPAEFDPWVASIDLIGEPGSIAEHDVAFVSVLGDPAAPSGLDNASSADLWFVQYRAIQHDNPFDPDEVGPEGGSARFAGDPDIITFETLAAGTFDGTDGAEDGVFNVLSVGGYTIGVRGDNPNSPTLSDLTANAAVIFDSADPSRGLFGLGTPNEDFGGPGIGAGGELGSPFVNDPLLDRLSGKTLIIDRDLINVDGDPLLIDDPAVQGQVVSTLTLDFSAVGTVTMDSLGVMDLNNGQTMTIRMFDAGDNLLAAFNAPGTGVNGVATVQLGGTPGVVRVEMVINGSAAIDNIIFRPEEARTFEDEFLTLGYTVTDGDDDTVSAAATIAIEDDGPTATDDEPLYVDGGEGGGGNVLDNGDNPGVDGTVDGGPLMVTYFTYTGEDSLGDAVALTAAADSTVITFAGGLLTVEADGEWLYEAPDIGSARSISDAGFVDDFSYLIQDGDGDTDSATQAIRVVLDPDGFVLGSNEAVIEGDAFDDFLAGAENANQIAGFEGNDLLFGGGDGDTLIGGTGDDQMYGDGGADIFSFSLAENEGSDIVGDFSVAEGDRLLFTEVVDGIGDPSTDFADVFVDGSFSKVGSTVNVTLQSGTFLAIEDVNSALNELDDLINNSLVPPS